MNQIAKAQLPNRKSDYIACMSEALSIFNSNYD